MRKRPTLTVGELMDYLKNVNPKAKIFLAPSLLNLDEPQATQEFIDDDNRKKCVAVESSCPISQTKRVTLGYAE